MLKRIGIITLAVFLSANSLPVLAEDRQLQIDDQELIDIAAPDSGNPKKNPVLENETVKTEFDMASESVHQRLEDSIAELNRVREQVADEKLPLSRKLSDLESKLSEVRLEYRKTTRLLDSRTLDLSNLRSEIKSRKQESTYLSNLLGEYIRNFESRLHIAEIQRYRKPLEEARLAPENSNLTEEEIYRAQADLLSLSLDRLHDAVGGSRFGGTATDSNGSIHQGKFLLIGPAAVFQSDDGKIVGNVEQRLGSLEPAVIAFGSEADSAAAAEVISGSAGYFPVDPSGGNAHKIEETKETLLAHIKKGGPVMYPIFAMAGAALLVALFKWICLTFTRKPAKKQIDSLLEAVAAHDENATTLRVKAIKGPVGKMLASAVEHIKEPRDLIEEVMYEKVLATRLKLERFLPFIVTTTPNNTHIIWNTPTICLQTSNHLSCQAVRNTYKCSNFRMLKLKINGVFPRFIRIGICN